MAELGPLTLPPVDCLVIVQGMAAANTDMHTEQNGLLSQQS